MAVLLDHRYHEIERLLAADRFDDAFVAAGTLPSGAARAAFLALAAIGAGDPETAFASLVKDSPETPEGAFLQIVRGNVLQTCGRLSDAFDAYESGLLTARRLNADVLLRYGRCWRDLALARFGDPTAVTDLAGLLAGSEDSAFVDLALAFLAAARTLLGLPADPSSPMPSAPGQRALFLASRRLGGMAVETAEIVAATRRAQGVPGAPDLVAAALADAADGSWRIRRYDRIAAFVAADDQNVFPELPDEPCMAPMDCARCDGRCCYDGVYVTGPEEMAIRAFMKEHPDDFRHVPDAFLEEGEWGFLFHGKRTVRVPHRFERPDFPKHFTMTRCVFALPSGECSLQKTATRELRHPWRFKPELCWEFPLIGLFNDNAMTKPHYFGEPDPGYADADHPGYLSFMPCARTDARGASWKRLYRNELRHYFKVKGIGAPSGPGESGNP